MMRFRTAVIAAGMAGVLLGGAPAAARPADGGWQALMAVQERLNAAGTAILASAERLPDGGGYAGIVAAPHTRTLKVFWHGEPPAAVAAAVGAARRGVPVQVLPAAYSRAALQRAVRRLVADPAVTVASPNPDGSGVTVRVTGTAALSAAAAGVPVTVEHGPAPVLTAGKQDDESPYYGGARWRRDGTGGCSTGFAVRHGGVGKLLSAGHCAANGQSAEDGGGDTMGPVGNDVNARDTLMIRATSAGHIYVGDYDSTTTRAVGGFSGSFPGNLVCRSSSYSNETCRILVTRIDQTLHAGGYTIFPIVEAEQLEHAAAAGAGDSGGSVFAYRSTDAKVTAFGTVTGGDVGNTAVPCTGITGTRVCAWRLYYVDIAKTLTHYGATLVTG
ncbi:hypothetical protein [Actinoplanes sp. NPDC049118]|uniref:hypothetical protein n=1 Tax=Actinoplanes sp. NPDC049118 TaxID=3155769 RepID=UPI0034069FF2